MKNNTEEEFFINIYNETYYNLRRFVERRSKNPALVDDILQEVYLEVFRHISDVIVHENQIGWIYKTADNKIKKINSIYIRYISHEINLDEREIQEASHDNFEFMEFEDYKKVLKDDEYKILMMKYKEGYTHKELAKITGNSVAGSKMKLSRIISKLRKSLKGDLIIVFFIIIRFL